MCRQKCISLHIKGFLKFYMHTAMARVMFCQLFSLMLMTRLHMLKNTQIYIYMYMYIGTALKHFCVRLLFIFSILFNKKINQNLNSTNLDIHLHKTYGIIHVLISPPCIKVDKWIISTQRTLLSRFPGIKCFSQSIIFHLKGLASVSRFLLFFKSESSQIHSLCPPKLYTDPKGKIKYCL